MLLNAAQNYVSHALGIMLNFFYSRSNARAGIDSINQILILYLEIGEHYYWIVICMVSG
jgi:hypothetical protein